MKSHKIQQPEAIAEKLIEHGRDALQQDEEDHIYTHPFTFQIIDTEDIQISSMSLDMGNNNMNGTIAIFIVDSNGDRICEDSKPFDVTTLPPMGNME